MFRWIPYTFVRTVLFFIGGILLALYAPDLISGQLAILLLASLTVFYFVVVFAGHRIRRILNPGVIALPLVFVLGFVHLNRKTESRDPEHLLHTLDTISHYKAVITRFSEEKPRSWKVEARVLSVHTKGGWIQKNGKVILYFSKQDFPVPFGYGAVLLMKGSPRVIQAPGNPGEFDYKRFLSFKNIYHQHFLRGNDVIRIGHKPPNQVMAYAIRVRDWAEATFKQFIKGEQEQAIASALVLGVKDGLDNELMKAYSATGSMHVLAVSGLHVSIIYIIIFWIFKPLYKLSGGRWMVAILCLLILWMYAFITGLSPSVLRAVAMFSFLAIAKPWARSTNIYNTLAVSAFFLLLFDPYMITAVGFQLSYLAVLGIVYLYPRFLSLWEPRQRLVTEIWKVICVSVSAQTATFSLGLLYFHQFPNYFLLSNLLVVPFAFVILILGLLVLSVSFVSSVAMVVGYCLEMIIRFVNFMVFSIESFPFSLTKDVYVSAFQCVLLMGLILVFIGLAESRKFKYLIVASLIIILYASAQWLHFLREENIQKLTVYKVPGHTAMDFIDRGQTYFLSDSVLRQDSQKINFHVTPNRLIAGVKSVITDYPNTRSFKGCELMAWQGKVLLHITDPGFEVPDQLFVDCLIIGNNAVYEVGEIALKLNAVKVVLDSSNTFFFADRFLEEAKLYNLDVYSVLHEGAFALKIENRNS